MATRNSSPEAVRERFDGWINGTRDVDGPSPDLMLEGMKEIATLLAELLVEQRAAATSLEVLSAR